MAHDITVWVLAVSIFVTICLENTLSFLVLVRSKHLLKSRYHRLLITLSVSDFMIGVMFGLRLMFRHLELPIAYILSEYLLYGSCLMSLMQMSIICIERLNATFAQPKQWIQWATSKKITIFLVILSILIGLSFGVYTIFDTDMDDYNEWISTAHQITAFTDIPLMGICLFMTVCYLVVIKRTKSQFLKIQPSTTTPVTPSIDTTGKPAGIIEVSAENASGTPASLALNASSNTGVCGNTSRKMSDEMRSSTTYLKYENNSKCRSEATTQTVKVIDVKSCGKERVIHSRLDHVEMLRNIKQRKLAEKQRRFKRNMLTLGIIILVTWISVLPKCVTSLLMLFAPDLVPIDTLKYVYAFLLINPIVNPVIYVLRISEFRKKVFVCRRNQPSMQG